MDKNYDRRKPEPALKLINMENVEVEQIEWLLYPFIPYGKLTIIQGDPGEGKTTMVLQIIAHLTKGESVFAYSSEVKTDAGASENAASDKMKDHRKDDASNNNRTDGVDGSEDEPDRADEDNLQVNNNIGTENRSDNKLESYVPAPEFEPVNVIYQTAEDGLGDTIKPRLLAAGADCSRVLVIDDREQPLTLQDCRLEEAIVRTKARLVVLDPIQGFLGADVDMHRANEIRPLMKRVSELAEKYHCAIILIGHMNKNSGVKSSYRGLGSIDFQAAARSVLLIGRIKDDPEVRVVCHVKSSLAPEGKSIAFRLDSETGFQWIGEYDVSADELLSGDSRGSKTKAAVEFLQEVLEDGQMYQRVIEEEAKRRGIKYKTLSIAKKKLGVKSVRVGAQWAWKLP